MAAKQRKLRILKFQFPNNRKGNKMEDIIRKTRDEFQKIRTRQHREEGSVPNNAEHLAAILRNKAEMEELCAKDPLFLEVALRYEMPDLELIGTGTYYHGELTPFLLNRALAYHGGRLDFSFVPKAIELYLKQIENNKSEN